MNLQEMNKLLIGGCVALVISFGLTLTCLFITGWAEIDTAVVDATYGLSRQCVTAGGNEECDKIDDPPAWLNACKGLLISAIVQNGIAIFSTVFIMYKTKMTAKCCDKWSRFGVLINGGLAVVQQFIVNVIYGVEFEDEYSSEAKLSHAYGLHVASNFIVGMGALLVFFSFKRQD